jgi:hypothetical protein
MRFTLTIDMENAAFVPGRARELRRILREKANDIRLIDVGDSGRIRDVNGNTVGEWAVTEDGQ